MAHQTSQESGEFAKHIMSFFARKHLKDLESFPIPERYDSVDLPVIVEFLSSLGFRKTYGDQSPVTGNAESCKVIVVCGKSGNRVILETDTSCCCSNKNIASSSSAQNQESTERQSIPSFKPPPLIRQKTWNRTELEAAVCKAGNQRLSVPSAFKCAIPKQLERTPKLNETIVRPQLPRSLSMVASFSSRDYTNPKAASLSGASSLDNVSATKPNASAMRNKGDLLKKVKSYSGIPFRTKNELKASPSVPAGKQLVQNKTKKNLVKGQSISLAGGPNKRR